MSRTRIKICGITQLDDAKCCADQGVDAIGLVFYEKSPRAINLSQAEKIAEHCWPFLTLVGLFVDAHPSFVAQVLANVPLHSLQFHGHETEPYCQQFGVRYIKAHRMQSSGDAQSVIHQYGSAQGILLDSYQQGVAGGTGTRFDWQWVPKTAPLPLILAGGLDVTNVAQAITTVRPYAVDVSGGVEASKGTKDQTKIIEFCREVNHVNAI